MKRPAPHVLVLGAAADCDLVVDSPQVSSRHARLTRSDEGWLLEDLGSTNGTFVDGQRVTSAVVTDTSAIGLGSFAISLSKVLAGRRPASPAQAVEVVTVGPRMVTIGRDAECDIVIDSGKVSGRHARVFRNCGRLILEDMGSANGTFVNHERVSWWVLRADDSVQIGPRTFRFQREVQPTALVQGARLDVRDVSVQVVDRQNGAPLTVLQDVAFTVHAGEVVGIMGPSGSGKTTLLWAMAGVSPPTSGEVLVDGASLHATDGALVAGLAAVVGFAPQDDILHPMLTVEETVRYAARLGSSRTTPSAEIEARVERAIADVGLLSKRAARVGSSTSKSLSGGQRKRVSIAAELVTDPPVLLLDEPTSGLSSTDAADLMVLLRKLADAGRTVVLTVHQPSYAMFVQMDQVAILDAGRLAYFGPTGVDAFEYFGTQERQAGALFDRLAEQLGSTYWADRYRASSWHQRCVAGRSAALASFSPPPRPPLRRPGRAAVLWLLLTRGLLMKTRDRAFWIVAVVVPLLASALVALVVRTQLAPGGAWSPGRAEVEHSYLIVITIMVCFFGALSSCLEILYERAVLERERRAGLSLGSYVGSKALLFAIPSVLHPATSLAVFLVMGGALEGAFAEYLSILVPAFFAAASAGLFLSALLSSAEGVVGLAVAYAIIQTVFSAFAPLHVSHGEGARHAWLDRVAAPITARWTSSGLVSRSDLCLEDAAASQALVTLADPSVLEFRARCEIRFYRDHGVYHAETSEDRTADVHRSHSVVANAILAFAALVAARLALTRRRN